MASDTPHDDEFDGATAEESQSEPLEFLKPRETARIQRARAPRRFIASLRFGLPIIALFFLLALFLWPVVNPNKIAKVVMTNIPDIVVQNPHYSGVDKKNQSYSISATTATRPSGMQNLYDLNKPEGEIQLQSGNWLAGKALFGRYDQDHRKLWLGGNVQIYHDKGYEFSSSEAQVDVDGNFAWGDKPVLIQGNFGEIRGQGFRLLDNGKVLVVTGPAKATLSLHSNDTSDKPTEPQKQE